MRSLFSEKVKGELARTIPSKRCCQIAELSTILRLEGNAEKKETGWEIEVTLHNPPAARKAFILFKRLARPTRLYIERTRSKQGRKVYSVRIGHVERADLPLVKAAQQGFRAHLPVPSRRCCVRAVVRAAFLCRGSLAEPERQNHLEMGVDAPTADYLTACLLRLGINAHRTTRRGHPVLYLKDGGQIVELLKELGAHNALLQLENVRIAKEVRNNINRLVNCETANVDKTVQAAMEQVAAIETIDRHLGLHRLPDKLREMAQLRLQHPYASFKELGESMSPPLSKSAVSYRVRRLLEIARQLKE